MIVLSVFVYPSCVCLRPREPGEHIWPRGAVGTEGYELPRQCQNWPESPARAVSALNYLAIFPADLSNAHFLRNEALI